MKGCLKGFLLRTFICAIPIAIVFSAAAGHAKQPIEKKHDSSIEELTRMVEELRRANDIRDAMIESLLQRIEELERQMKGPPMVSALEVHSASDATSAVERGMEEAQGEHEAASTDVTPELIPSEGKSAVEVGKADKLMTPLPEIDEAEKERRIRADQEENARLIKAAFEPTLIRAGGLLMKPYQLGFEPSYSYAHSSHDRIILDGFSIFPVLIVGDIVSERTRRDIFTTTNTIRLGLPHDFQVETAIPVGYESERIYRGDGETRVDSTSGLGDISFSLSHQFVKAHRWWPDTLASITWKTKTGEDPYSLRQNEEVALGTGFHTLRFTLTTVKVSDPLVFYSGLSYANSLSDEKAIGDVDMGDSYGLHLGTSMAINLDTSLSLGFQLQYTDETEVDGQSIDGSDYTTSMLNFGVSRVLTDRLAMDIDVGAGLTEDSTDLQLTLAFPYYFN